MSNDDNEIEAPTIIAPPSAADAFADLMTLCLRSLPTQRPAARGSGNCKSKRLQRLGPRPVSPPRRAAHDAHVARTQAELDRQKIKLGALADELASKAARLDEQHARLADFAKELTNRETALKRRMLTLAGEHDRGMKSCRTLHRGPRSTGC